MTRRAMRPVLATAALFTAAALALSGCAPSSDGGGDDTARTTLNIGMATEISALIPWQQQGYNFSQNAGFTIFDTLLKFDDDGEAVPVLATGWEISDDQTQTTFTIRDDAKFHNGDPVTAADVAYSIDIRANPDSIAKYGSWALFGADMYGSVEATDDTTVVVTTTSAFRLIDAMRRVMVVPEGSADDANFGQNPIGSGPFAFVSFDPGVKLTVKANEDYWGGVPAIKTLTFNTIADIGAQASALRSGDIDALYDIKSAEYAQVAGVEGLKELQTGTFFSWWMTQTGHGLTASPEGRAALRYLFDTNQMNASAYGGEGIATWNPFDETPVGIGQAVDVTYDPVKAGELLEAAGLQGETLSILALEGLEDSERMGQLLEQAAIEAGLTVDFRVLSVPDYLATTYSDPTWDGIVYGAGTLPFPFYDAFDYMILGNPDMAAMIAQMRGASDDELATLVIDAQKMMIDDTLVLPAFVAPVRTLIPTGLSGVEATTFGDVRWGEATFE
ncbi:MAG TPA: ABC transporter substrate-binding protein [Protaetiibacter sp.]|nr:ABC transporter substrate-binding protein [Protaetiibacter sp.]